MGQTIDIHPASAARPASPRLIFAAVAAAALVAGFLPWTGASGQASEAELALLLRFMALIKGAMALAAAGLVWWRFGYEMPPALSWGYGAAIAAMAGATGLIFNLEQVVPGAVLFHAGLFGFIGLIAADGGGRGAVGTAIAARRARLQAG